MSLSQNSQKSAGEYGREALAQWRDAARLGARAIAERKKEKGSVKQGIADKGTSELGELADAALSKLGKSGKLAAKARVGSRVVNHLLPTVGEGDEGAGEGEEEGKSGQVGGDAHLFDEATPIPIQEAIDVAVPVAAVFDLATRFEELPQFSERIGQVEVEDDSHFAVEAKVGVRQQTLQLEIVGEEPEERLDWECAEGVKHAGVVTFHPLAPRLTRVELTIEQESEGTLERLLRLAGLPERAIRQELRRFKAYAELWDEANEYRSADFKDPASEPAPEESGEEDEEPEEEDGEGSDEEAGEPLEDEELEPAASE